jgi:hypothetical protein
MRTVENVKKLLTRHQFKILEYIISGKSVHEITELQHCSRQSVYQTIRHIEKRAPGFQRRLKELVGWGDKDSLPKMGRRRKRGIEYRFPHMDEFMNSQHIVNNPLRSLHDAQDDNKEDGTNGRSFVEFIIKNGNGIRKF